jgi:hypothetical protein
VRVNPVVQTNVYMLKTLLNQKLLSALWEYLLVPFRGNAVSLEAIGTHFIYFRCR